MQKVDGKDKKNEKDGNEYKIEKCITDIGAQVCQVLLPLEQNIKASESTSKSKVRIQSPRKIKPQNALPNALPVKLKQKRDHRLTLEIEEKQESARHFIRKEKEAERKKNTLEKNTRLDVINEDEIETEPDLWEGTSSIKSSYSGYNFQERRNSKWCRPSYIPISFILILIFLVVLLPLLDQNDARVLHLLNKKTRICKDSCSFELVESIPQGLIYPPGSVRHRTTFEVWKNLISISEKTIEIASFYWTLRKTDVFPDPSSYQGDEIYNDLLNAGLNRNIKIKIAQNQPSEFQPNPDTEYLAQLKAAEVKSLNFSSLMGAGILHTKFWIVDNKHIYIGSANMDWRSLTQVKELGAVIYNCPCIADDLGKVFQVYWDLGGQNDVPDSWPDEYATRYNMQTPLNVSLNGEANLVYISSSPPPFSPKGRTHDIDALLNTISSANRFVYIAVMDYFPLKIYSLNLEYWPLIDNELRRAVVERGVYVRLLISYWGHTRPMMFNFLRSLMAISKFNRKTLIEVRLFKVPSNSTQSQIPFARVNHNKYMVTDNSAFIGTSNWSGDYFVDTAGVSLVITSTDEAADTIRLQLGQVFQRDWDSEFSSPLIL